MSRDKCCTVVKGSTRDLDVHPTGQVPTPSLRNLSLVAQIDVLFSGLEESYIDFREREDILKRRFSDLESTMRFVVLRPPFTRDRLIHQRRDLPISPSHR